MHPRALVRSIAVAAVALLATSIIALPAAPASAISVQDRLAGPGRYDASVAMSRAMPLGSTVFLVSGESFPDALAAAPVAAAERAHMLLTTGRDIPPVIEREIRRIAPSTVVLVGAEATLSAAVRAEAAALAPGARIDRIAGANRVHTSMLLVDRLRKRVPAADIWVASGRNFPDALAAGAVAARRGQGLILTLGADDYFQREVARRLTGTQRFLVAGSADAVSDDVVTALKGTGRSVQRYAGSDRYATAAAINRAFTTSAANATVLLASGANFPDALGGAVLAGVTGRPLYLTHPPCASSHEVLWEAGRLGATRVVALGGPPSVSTAAAQLRSCDSIGPAAQLDAAVDEHRAGLDAPAPPLAREACLDAMAQGWATQMAARRLTGASHNPALDAEARACGMRGWAENVGRTGGAQPDVERMLAAWLASEGHRVNLERATMQHIGVGMARSSDGYWYYVLNFGRR